MIYIYSLLAIFIAWIWVDYFRLINIFKKDNLKYFLFIFILGGASVFIVWALNHFWLDSLWFQPNGDFDNDFSYAVFKIGAVEELAKLVPFVIFYLLFKKALHEPIDYLAYICTSALGFSAVENILYFVQNGPDIITLRAILPSVSHMFDTSLIAYGVILYKFRHRKHSVLYLLGFFFLASLSHGFYDFWLIYEHSKGWGSFITILYFLISVSWFATILNNAMNNSSQFSYKMVVRSNDVANRLLLYYAIVVVVQFTLQTISQSFVFAFMSLLLSMSALFIIIVTCVRLSRFTLIKGRWNPIKLELPFTRWQSLPYEPGATVSRISIKGDSFDESIINSFYQEYFYLSPLSNRGNYLTQPHLAYIEKKLHLRYDQAFYVAKIFTGTEEEPFERVLLKPKKYGTNMIGKHPIAAILSFDHIENVEDTSLTARDFKFLEWGVLKAREDKD